MLFYTAPQAQIFLATLFAGLASGALYGLTERLAALFSAGLALRAALDLFFCLGSAALLLAALLLQSGGELRVYCLIGFFLGFSLQRATLGRLLGRALDFFCPRLLRFAARLCAWGPVRKIFR